MHIQYLMMPLTPFQYRMYQEGQHFTARRFFPLTYIKSVLALGEAMEVTMDTPVDDIISHFDDRVNYDAMHAICYAQVERSHAALANWQARDFGLLIESDGTVVGSEQTKAALIAADKGTIQNYGRPYKPDGRPSGTYYKYARSERVPEWNDIESTRLSQSLLPALERALPNGSGTSAPQSSMQRKRSWLFRLFSRTSAQRKEAVTV